VASLPPTEKKQQRAGIEVDLFLLSTAIQNKQMNKIKAR